MLTHFELEAIGDDTSQLLGSSLRSPWVAKITGTNHRYGLDRSFVKSTKDYSKANSVGSRGVMLNYWLDDGIYEVNELKSWRKSKRYFISVVNGTHQVVDADYARDFALYLDRMKEANEKTTQH